MRSKFFTDATACDSDDETDRQALQDTNELVAKIIELCKDIQADLGVGHSEATYETALIRCLYNAGIPCLRQAPWFTTTRDGDIISAGIVDLEVAKQVIVELKIGTGIKHAHIAQVDRYLRAAKKVRGSVVRGVVIMFRDDGQVQSADRWI